MDTEVTLKVTSNQELSQPRDVLHTRRGFHYFDIIKDHPPRYYRRKRSALTDPEFAGTSKKALRPRNLANKSKQQSIVSNAKHRSRRNLFKKYPARLAPPSPFVRLEARYFHKGIWLQISDIVCVTDIDGGIYYAQLRNIIMDRSENAYAVLTWIIPTMEATPGLFEPGKYVIGMEEDVPREIDCCSFVCRCPSDYFRPVDSPYTISNWNYQQSASNR